MTGRSLGDAERLTNRVGQWHTDHRELLLAAMAVAE